MTLTRRLVARYRIATDPFVIRGTWANITGYKDSLRRMAQAVNDLADLFQVPHLKHLSRDLRALASAVESLEQEGDWFRNYVEGSDPPFGVDDDLQTILGMDLPWLDDILEALDQSPYVKTLRRSHKVHRRPVERAVNALYDWVEDPSDEQLKDWAHVEQERLKNLDMRDVEEAYRRFSEVDPESLKLFLSAKKWVQSLTEAKTVEELAPLLEVWEDEVVAIGDEEYLSNFSSDEQSPWRGLVHLDVVLKDLSRNTERLVNLIFPD